MKTVKFQPVLCTQCGGNKFIPRFYAIECESCGTLLIGDDDISVFLRDPILVEIDEPFEFDEVFDKILELPINCSIKVNKTLFHWLSILKDGTGNLLMKLDPRTRIYYFLGRPVTVDDPEAAQYYIYGA